MSGALHVFLDWLTAPQVVPEPPTQLPAFDSYPIGLDRKTRIAQEVLMVAPRFAERGGVYFDEENSDWLMIPKYSLPSRWREPWCQLLIVFPTTYPVSPPIGFYLNKRFRLATGRKDQHLLGDAQHGAANLVRNGWYWYCVEILTGFGGWQPSPNYNEPDNLWTFLNLIRDVLTNDE